MGRVQEKPCDNGFLRVSPANGLKRTDRRYEIILVDSGTDHTAELIADRYPDVRLMRFANRLYCGDARNLGMKAARAPLIAFLDADCLVRDDWVDAICDAHCHSNLVISGSVHNGSPSLTGWAYYFCEFSLLLPAKKPRHISEAPGCALSMKREAFDQFGPFLENTYCSDTAFQWRMRTAGEQILFWPHIAVTHTYQQGWRFLLSHIYEHRRHFAQIQSKERRWGYGRRMIAATMMPCLPPLLLFAVVLRLCRVPQRYTSYLKS